MGYETSCSTFPAFSNRDFFGQKQRSNRGITAKSHLPIRDHDREKSRRERAARRHLAPEEGGLSLPTQRNFARHDRLQGQTRRLATVKNPALKIGREERDTQGVVRLSTRSGENPPPLTRDHAAAVAAAHV